MEKVLIQKIITAWQWNGEEAQLPDGFYLCKPEVHYSAGKDVVYFTYADLPSKHWISTQRIEEMPKTDALHYCMRTENKDGTAYFRKVFPFAFYDIKSHDSLTRDYSAKFLDEKNFEEREAFLDYCALEKWPEKRDPSALTFSLPARCEYRETSGSYGRGYRPYYLKKGDWLILDGEEIKVLSDQEFKALKPPSVS